MIRPLSPADDPAVLQQLLVRSFARAQDHGVNFSAAEETLAMTLARLQNQSVWVAEDSGQIVGVIFVRQATQTLFYRTPGVWVFGPVGVTPDHQGRGLGKALIAAAEQHARDQGGRILALSTAGVLLPYYHSLGFQVLEEVDWEGKTYQSHVLWRPLQEVTVRPMAFGEAEPFAEVVRACFDEHDLTWDAQGYCSDLYRLPGSYPDGFWVAERKGEIIGGAGLCGHPRISGEPRAVVHIPKPRIAGTDCEVVRLYVHPDARRLGAGRLLNDAVVNEARWRDWRAMEIWSDKKFDKAHALYESVGAERVGERICDDPDGSPEWGFFLDLSELPARGAGGPTSA